MNFLKNYATKACKRKYCYRNCFNKKSRLTKETAF